MGEGVSRQSCGRDPGCLASLVGESQVDCIASLGCIAICIDDTLLSPSYVAYIATGTGRTLLSPPLPPVGMAGLALPPMTMAASTQ